MKLFGSLSEIVNLVFRKNSQAVTLRPSQTTTYTASRDIQLPPGDAAHVLMSADSTQTVTNKTLGSTNTITGATAASFTNSGTVNLPSGADTLLGRTSSDTGSNRVQNKELSNNNVKFVDNTDTTKKIAMNSASATTGTELTLASATTTNRTVTFPDASTTLVGNDNTATLTNKILQADLVDNYLDYNEESAPSTPSSGTGRTYVSTDGKFKFVNDSGITKTLGDAGTGEINAVLNPTDAAAGWTAGTSHAVSTVTSGSPLDPLVPSAIQIQATANATESSTSGGIYTISNLSASLVSKKLKVEFYVISPSADTWRLSVYQSTTRQSLSTDSSSATTIPAGFTGKFTAYFDTSTSTSYSVNFTRTAGSGTTNLVITQVIVGPGIQPQGAVVGEWQSFTPTGSWVSNATYTGRYRQVGDSIDMSVRVVLSGAPTATSLQVNLPTGLTLDTSKLLNNGDIDDPIGTSSITDASTGEIWLGGVLYSSTTAVQPTVLNSASTGRILYITNTAPVTFASGDEVYFDCFNLPISQFSGAGTINVAQNDVEYAFNTSLTDANDSTSFGYGPGGSQFANFTTNREKRVRFQTPMQATDNLVLEISRNSGVTWQELETSSTVQSFATQNANNYGMYVNPANSTDVDVGFANYRIATGATFGAAGAPWSDIDNDAQFKWRVKKIKSGTAVGFGIVSESAAGLIPSSNSSLDNASATRLGFKQYLHGTTYNGGVAPTVTGVTSVARAVFVPYQTSDGGWRMKFNVDTGVSSNTSQTLTVNGVVFKNGPNQALAFMGDVVTAARAFTNSNAATMSVGTASAVTAVRLTGDVELESKPTWAY